MPVRVSFAGLLFWVALIFAVQLTGQVPFLVQVILASNSNFSGLLAFTSSLTLVWSILTVTPAPGAAERVTVASTSLAVVVAMASISKDLLPLTEILAGTTSLERATSAPGGGGVTVVPVPEALTEPLPPLLVMLIVAVLAPVVAGLKATVNVWLAPTATLNGVAGEVSTKSVALLLEMLLTVSGAVPVFDMVTVCAAEVVPTF